MELTENEKKLIGEALYEFKKATLEKIKNEGNDLIGFTNEIKYDNLVLLCKRFNY